MATPLLTGGFYDFFITTVIFIFVFAVLYALLSKMDWFGENKHVHVFIAFAAALLVIFIPETKELINFMTPWFVIFLILLIFIMLAIMTLGIKGTEISDYLKNASPGTTTFVVVIIIIIFLAAIYHVFGPVLTPAAPGEAGLWAVLTRGVLQPKILGVIFLLIIASVIVKTIGFREP